MRSGGRTRKGIMPAWSAGPSFIRARHASSARARSSSQAPSRWPVSRPWLD